MTIRTTAPVLAIIPARGGSKGIPRKNLLPLVGKPLIAWTIEAVTSAEHPIRCVVSTDDDEIADVAMSYGAEVVWRPSVLATDDAPTEPSLLHVLDCLEAEGYEPSCVMLLQATSPVRQAGRLDAALAQFHEQHATSLVGVVEVHPFIWSGPIAAPTASYDTDSRPRRQDIVDSQRRYRETGSLYITDTQALRASNNRICGSTVLHVLSPEEGDDIDTLQDVDTAIKRLEGLSHAARP